MHAIRAAIVALALLALMTVALAVYATQTIHRQEQTIDTLTDHVLSLESQQHDLEVVIANDQARLTESGN